MPRLSTLAVRTNQLRALKELQTMHRDREKRLAELQKQIDIAHKANFPASALAALAQEVTRLETLDADSQLATKVDVLERWITAEQAYLQAFPAPARGAKRGRPRRAKPS